MRILSEGNLASNGSKKEVKTLDFFINVALVAKPIMMLLSHPNDSREIPTLIFTKSTSLLLTTSKRFWVFHLHVLLVLLSISKSWSLTTALLYFAPADFLVLRWDHTKIWYFEWIRTSLVPYKFTLGFLRADWRPIHVVRLYTSCCQTLGFSTLSWFFLTLFLQTK